MILEVVPDTLDSGNIIATTDFILTNAAYSDTLTYSDL